MKNLLKSLRKRPVLVGFISLTAITLIIPFNFVILAPGPTVNLLDGPVSVKGFDSTSNKNDALYSAAIYASGPDQMPLGFQLLNAWADGNIVVMPRNALYDNGEKADVAKKRQLKEMTDSQVNAALAAWNFISEIPGHAKPTWNENDVKITLENTGGGSAGLAFSLALIAKTADPNLINGRKIAATGTISENGKVGEIGGVDQKIISASRRGVQIFLMPKESCSSLSKHPKGMKIYAVSTLSQAVHALALADSTTDSSIFACPKK